MPYKINGVKYLRCLILLLENNAGYLSGYADPPISTPTSRLLDQLWAPSDRLAFIAGTNSDSQMSSYDTQMTRAGSYLIQIDSVSRCIPYAKPMEFY